MTSEIRYEDMVGDGYKVEGVGELKIIFNYQKELARVKLEYTIRTCKVDEKDPSVIINCNSPISGDFEEDIEEPEELEHDIDYVKARFRETYETELNYVRALIEEATKRGIPIIL